MSCWKEREKENGRMRDKERFSFEFGFKLTHFIKKKHSFQLTSNFFNLI